MVELVQELESLPKSPGLDFIIKEAKAGQYHDFKNEKYDCGKVALVDHLTALGLAPIAQRVIDGEFDEKPDAEDIEMLKSIAPRSAWKALGLE